MKLFKRNTYELALHEIGHWFVANKLGFCVGDLELMVKANEDGTFIIKGMSQLNVNNFNLNTVCSIQEYIKSRIYILNAGCMAGAFVDGEFNPDKHLENIKIGGGATDYYRIVELFSLLERICHEINRNDLWYEIDSTSLHLVKSNFNIINSLALFVASKVIEDGKLYKISKDELLREINKNTLMYNK